MLDSVSSGLPERHHSAVTPPAPRRPKTDTFDPALRSDVVENQPLRIGFGDPRSFGELRGRPASGLVYPFVCHDADSRASRTHPFTIAHRTSAS